MEPDPDLLFHETDPRIRIRIKMKRIRNTAYWIGSNVPLRLDTSMTISITVSAQIIVSLAQGQIVNQEYSAR